MSMTDSLCLSQTVRVRNIKSVSFTNSLFLLQIVCVFHKQTMSVTDSCVCHRQFVSVTDCWCPSQTVFVFTDGLCLSQTIFVCHRQSVSVIDTLLDHSWPGFSLLIHDFHQDSFCEILICLAFKYHQYKLCGLLGRGYTLVFETFLKLSKLQCKSNFNRN